VRNSLVEYRDIVLQRAFLLLDTCQNVCHSAFIATNLISQGCLRLVNKVAMVHPLHTSFQTERDQQADGDRCQVNEKVAPAVNRLMRWMHIKHGSDLVNIHC
jgi:hypothetical protein